MTNHEAPARDALMQAHVALAAQAARDQAALARVRRLHDALDAETDLTSPDDEITRGAAAKQIAAALDGWSPPAAVSVPPPAPRADDQAALDRVRALHQPIDGDGGPYCQTCTQDEEQPHPVGWWMPFPCPTVQVVDEELRRLADEVQQPGGPVAGEQQNETPEARPLLCPRCGDDISEYGEDDFVFRTGDERPYCSGECIVAAHRAALSTAPAVVAQPGKEPAAEVQDGATS